MNGHTENSKTDDSSTSKLSVKFADNFIVDGHTEYRILVRDSKKNEAWTVTQRYSELRKVHLRLRDSFPNNLPAFPSRKVIGNMEPSFISQRQKALEKYFSLVLENQTWANSRPLKDLLMTKTHTKSIVKDPKEESKQKKKEASPSEPTGKPDAIRPEKPSPYHVALEKNLDQISNKFFDLQSNLNPPEEEEFKKKGYLYSKISEMGSIKTADGYFKLPAGNANLVVEARSESDSQHHQELQKNLKDTLANIRELMNSQHYLSKIDIICHFK